MTIEHVFAGMPTADYARALAWYEQVLGRPPDVIVKEDEAMWQLAERAWIYVVAAADRAGHTRMTILVDDIEAFVADLTSRGVAPDPIVTEPGLFRRTVLSDPDGNHFAVAQSLGPETG